YFRCIGVDTPECESCARCNGCEKYALCYDDAGSPDYSGICNDGNDWLSDLSVTTPDGETMTCSQGASYFSSPGQALANEDLSDGWSCAGKSYDVTMTIGPFQQLGCCGSGSSACEADDEGVVEEPVDPDGDEDAGGDGIGCASDETEIDSGGCCKNSHVGLVYVPVLEAVCCSSEVLPEDNGECSSLVDGTYCDGRK
ncbi:hypothetical protein TrST_g4681, partial [Triparma strigata]